MPQMYLSFYIIHLGVSFLLFPGPGGVAPPTYRLQVTVSLTWITFTCGLTDRLTCLPQKKFIYVKITYFI